MRACVSAWNKSYLHSFWEAFKRDHRESVLLVLHVCVQAQVCVCLCGCVCACVALSGSRGSRRERCEESALKTKGRTKQR